MIMVTILAAALCAKDAALCEAAANAARGDLVKLEASYAKALAAGWSVGELKEPVSDADYAEATK